MLRTGLYYDKSKEITSQKGVRDGKNSNFGGEFEGNMASLTVYRASAGSGKTFTLATRFIELLIENPTSYKEILAVTFTIKATEEMKERILSQLYGLSKGLTDSDSYLEQIMCDLGYGATQVRERAGKALQYILHDFSNFNVETIDSFFQRILRNIAKELELNANLRVELNSDDIEEMAVDRLLTELKADDKVLKWIMDYINQNISEDKKWDVTDNIKQFGKKIFQHEYKENATAINEKLQTQEFFTKYQSTLRAIVKKADEAMEQRGTAFFNLIKEGGYAPEDFNYGWNGAVRYFKKLMEGNYKDDKIVGARVVAAMQNPDEWVKKSELNSPKHVFASTRLTPLLVEVEQERKQYAVEASSASVILAHLNELRLLNNIEQVVKDINSEANIFLLSDTQHILQNLMEGSDAPFIFEKIGSRIHHLMIDEFQDTSVIQWNNFKKLLLECMAHHHSRNLIVGDVKQSIYRWRNSDWRLLNNISTDDDLEGKEVRIENLRTNFRSERNIIRFNNEFFSLAPDVEQRILELDGNKNAALISQIYSRELTEQDIPKGKEPRGLVDITLLPKKDFSNECIKLTCEHIQTLLGAGAEEKDIAILCRGNRDLARLGSSLKEAFPECTFVSDEAFQLASSVAVNILVNAMKALCKRQDRFVRAQLASDYQVYILGHEASELFFHSMEDLNKHLPVAFLTNFERLRVMPLNDMAEAISQIFEVENLKNETAYINAFFDQLSTFTQTNTPDLNAFAEYWDNTMCTKAVKGGDINGIRLLTIHKAKGLEFDHVLLPFCNWEMDKGNTLWCKTDVKPYSDMPIVPVGSKKLKGTIFSDAYYEEKLQTAVDNLNMLYVAFTRASKNLFVIGANVKTKDGISFTHRSGLLQELLPQVASVLQGASTFDMECSKEEVLHFTYGNLYIKNDEEKVSENIFLPRKEKLSVNISPTSLALEFRQSNRSRAFVMGEDTEVENQKYITQGTILHKVLSQIRDIDDVERVLNGFIAEGVVSESGTTLNRKSLSRLIRQRIEENKNPIVKEWFSKNVEVFNECSILSIDPQTGLVRELRPDRIVKQGDQMTIIDFKFGNPKEEHHAQVRGYMELLRDMGYGSVRGYIWYVYGNSIVDVK